MLEPYDTRVKLTLNSITAGADLADLKYWILPTNHTKT